MKEVTIKIQFDDEGCYDGHGDDVAELIKDGIETYLRIDFMIAMQKLLLNEGKS
jgi:hypothetical protein